MQHADIKTLARQVLSRNTARNNDATNDKKVVASGGKNNVGLLHAKTAVFQVFEYRLNHAGPWLILLSTNANDTVEKLSRELPVRFGCSVEIWRRPTSEVRKP